MFGQNNSRKDKNFTIFVVRSIDDSIVENETYNTGVRDGVTFILNEARRSLDRLGKDYYTATDNPEVAKEYGIKLFKENSY